MAQAEIDVQKIVQHIRKHEKRFTIFQGLSDRELEAVLKDSVVVQRPRDKMLFRKGQPGREMYIILQGRVDIVDHYDGHHKIINILGEGEVFGEVALFGDHTRSASAKTHDAVLMLVVNEENLLAILNSSGGARFIMNILHVMSERLEHMTHRYMKSKYGDKGPDEPVRRWID